MGAYPVRAILARLFLLGLLILVLNLSVRSHKITQAWSDLHRLMLAGDHTSQSTRSTFRHFFQLAQAQPWRKDLWHVAGIYALRAGDWQAGLDFLTRIDFRGLDASEWLLVGDTYANLGEWDKAASAWNKSLSLVESQDGYRRLYELHKQKADFEAIVRDLKAMSRIEPGNAELAYQLAIYLAAQDPQGALDWIDLLQGIDGDYRARIDTLEQKLLLASLADSTGVQYMIAGQGLADLGEWELAKMAFQHSLQLAPGYAEAWAFLGEARQKVHPPEPEAALKDLQHALALDPGSISAITMLALYWQRQGEMQRASDLFRTAASLDPQNPAWYAALGSLAGAQGKLTDAEWYYRFAVDLAPQQSAYYVLLANFYITNQIQVKEKALPAASKAVEIDSQNPENLTTLAQVYLLLDDRIQAIELLRSALEIDQDYARSHLLLGMAYLYQGQAEDARDHLLKASENAQDSATLEQAQRAIRYYFP